MPEGESRTVYSEEFLHRFKMLYAKYGRDSECLDALRSEYPQYINLSTNNLTKVRRKRSKAFSEAREEHIKAVTTLDHKIARDLLVNARSLSNRTVQALMDVQERFLNEFELLDPTDEDCTAKTNQLVSNVVAIQEKINAFAGIDMDNQLRIFKQKLLAKKIADEKTLDEVIRLFTIGSGEISLTTEMTSQGRPSLVFHKEDKNED